VRAFPNGANIDAVVVIRGEDDVGIVGAFRLAVPMAFKAARIREVYINDVRRILGDVEVVAG
jgi:hypothetical protein